MKAVVIFINLLIACSSHVINKRSLLRDRGMHGHHGHHQHHQLQHHHARNAFGRRVGRDGAHHHEENDESENEKRSAPSGYLPAADDYEDDLAGYNADQAGARSDDLAGYGDDDLAGYETGADAQVEGRGKAEYGDDQYQYGADQEQYEDDQYHYEESSGADPKNAEDNLSSEAGYSAPTEAAASDQGRSAGDGYGPPAVGYASNIDQSYAAPDTGRAADDDYASPDAGRAADDDYASPDAGRAAGDDYAAPDAGRVANDDYASPGAGRAADNDYVSPDAGRAAGDGYAAPDTGRAADDGYAAGRAADDDYAAPDAGEGAGDGYAAPDSGRAAGDGYAAPDAGRAAGDGYAAPDAGRAADDDYDAPGGEGSEYEDTEEAGARDVGGEYAAPVEDQAPDVAGAESDYSDEHGAPGQYAANQNGFPFAIVEGRQDSAAATGNGEAKVCPGGSLDVCVSVCPGVTARVYGACVQGCADRCTQA